MYQKSQSYDVWFLRYGVRQNFLLFWAIFCPFTLPPTLWSWKSKFSIKMKRKKKKKPGDIILLCTHVYHKWRCGSWNIRCDRQKFLSFWTIFYHFSPPQLVRWFQTPLFKALTPCPLFFKSLFLLPSFMFHPLLRYFRQFPPPLHNPLLPQSDLTGLKKYQKGDYSDYTSSTVAFYLKINF